LPLACKMGLFVFPAAGSCSKVWSLETWQGLAAGGRAGCSRGAAGQGSAPKPALGPFASLPLPLILAIRDPEALQRVKDPLVPW